MASKRTRSSPRPARAPAAANVQSKDRPSSPRVFLIALLILYFVLAAAYNRLVPLRTGAEATRMVESNQLPTNPDEATHVLNGILYKSGHIPVFQAGSPDFEAHQPPLYYAIIAPFLSASPDNHAPADAARWISILIGALMIVVSYAAVREAFPARIYLAQGVAAFVGLLPVNVNLNASITNDTLTNLVVALGLWQLTRVVMRAATLDRHGLVAQTALLGVIVGLGIYTKTSTVVLIATIGVAGIAAARLRVMTMRDAAILVCGSIGIGLALGAPWFIRNTRLYGDPIAQHLFQTAFIGTTMTTARMLEHISFGQYLWLTIRLTFESFWLLLNPMQWLAQPILVYGALAVLWVASIPGLGRSAVLRESSDHQKVVLTAMATLLAVTLIGFIRFNMTFFQAQGRYLYTGLIPVAFFFMVGLTGLFGKRSEAAAIRFPTYAAAALVLLNAFVFRFIFGVGG